MKYMLMGIGIWVLNLIIAVISGYIYGKVYALDPWMYCVNFTLIGIGFIVFVYGIIKEVGE